MAVLKQLAWSPVVQVVAVWHILWGAVAIFADAAFLIEVMNGLVLATACGVVAAYLPLVRNAVLARHPSSSDLLTAGIWLAWLSVIEQRIWSISWRAMGSPAWFLNTDFTTHFISVTMLAGLFHLAGPEAIDGRVPTKQWIRIGLIVGAGALVTFGLMYGSARMRV